ncbi:MAG: glutamine amidotransferase family protein [Rhodospirillaceae bacterium]|nr:glutamine amidotransferase family protein [Rhodospirillaceae bacterium]|tara:strand:+ start:326 stop:1222 length:897 start_codon:yes stop_codon:yes gene_type:complete
MCGIVGLFLKDRALDEQLGQLLSQMLITMSERGPDSAGIAIYGDPSKDESKITVQSSKHFEDFDTLENICKQETWTNVRFLRKDNHAVIITDTMHLKDILHYTKNHMPNLRIMSVGDSVEIYKETGLPREVIERFSINNMSGTHGIGHTRMATESAVTTLGAHPFSTAPDQCLVHNGSLSNHNNLRRDLLRDGINIETDNDSEIAAAYLTNQMAKGLSLRNALEESLNDLDGFFTFVVGTKQGFGVLRDPIACKPAVMAETEKFVAFGSEYRALVDLPGIEAAHIWEPEPATVYFWGH